MSGTSLIGPLTLWEGGVAHHTPLILDALGAERRPLGVRGPSGDHMLLAIAGEHQWLLGPSARRTSSWVALRFAQQLGTPVRWSWLESHGADCEVQSELIHPDGNRQRTRLSLPEESTSGYSDGDPPIQSPSTCICPGASRTMHLLGVARYLARGEEGLRVSRNWGMAPWETIVGVWRMSAKHPKWPTPPALPVVPAASRVVRRRPT